MIELLFVDVDLVMAGGLFALSALSLLAAAGVSFAWLLSECLKAGGGHGR